MLKNFSTPGFRFSDEENFEDLKERSRKMLAYLQNRSEEKIVVVTHGFILRIVIAYVIFGESLTGIECERFIQKFHMENKGLTVLDYGGEDREAPRD
ncbi:MAG: histidine phosphatase family protein [Minisyncoccota bacterium]